VGSRGTWGFQVYHAITPESDRWTSQYWTLLLPHDFLDSSQYERFDKIMGRQVVEEDIEAYVAQQNVIDLIDPEKGRAGDVSERGNIRADTGLVMARRLLDGLIAKERQAVPA
jgi:hypothetical protein